MKTFAILLLSVLLCLPAAAQLEVKEFNVYWNNISHRAFVLNDPLSCDSLNLRDARNKKPAAEELTCAVLTFGPEDDFSFYERDGISLCMDAEGLLYSRDIVNSGQRIYLGYNIYQLSGKKSRVVLETDETDYDSVTIRLNDIAAYRLGQVNSRKAYTFKIKTEDFVFKAKGELSPALQRQIADEIKILPEDGKIADDFTIILPMQLVNVPGDFSLYIYDLKGNIIRMFTGLKQKEHVLLRENLGSGTYKYKILFNRNIEIRAGLIHLKEAPRPEAN